ncbi:uncharacterized protein BJ212DRAFT_591165 [Suillus subaureus]|uniref:Uncharacterized protein n=1 Tax=Suillus subaureus TaxID=48587 RepID=A0A9P7AUH0_9AGAM|nr:uncharacterized protein BJ212DRAFT_591165 [Suillus subaureus]KAG1795273.1 hypothetical protein BJ212DRAFT_591165 [Suillus subaureus]
MLAVLFNASLGWPVAGAILIVRFNNDGNDSFIVSGIMITGCMSQSLLTRMRPSMLTYCPSCFCPHFKILGQLHGGVFAVTNVENTRQKGSIVSFSLFYEMRAYFLPLEFYHCTRMYMPLACLCAVYFFHPFTRIHSL